MHFRHAILVPLATVIMLAFTPAAAQASPIPPGPPAAPPPPTLAECLGRAQVHLCLLEIPSNRGFSRVPGERL